MSLDGVVGREIEFANLFNVRDLGGHRTRDGRRVREGRWFRGAGLHRIAGEDVERLRALGIEVVLDLRTEQEIADHGAFPADVVGVEVRHLPLIPRTWPHGEGLEDPEVALAYLIERFTEMLESGRAGIAAAVQALAEPETGPLIAFCMAGKDRTGVLTATVLSLLGVPDEDVARDFHRSQAAMPAMLAWLAEHEPGPASTMVQQSAHVRAAPPEAILGFLAEARRRYGSIADYVVAAGAQPRDVDRLRATLLA